MTEPHEIYWHKPCISMEKSKIYRYRPGLSVNNAKIYCRWPCISMERFENSLSQTIYTDGNVRNLWRRTMCIDMNFSLSISMHDVYRWHEPKFIVTDKCPSV
ncbi:unnamed protein product [Sphacelaria rigidula]